MHHENLPTDTAYAEDGKAAHVPALVAADTLASVCHHWREICLAAPTVWCHIAILFISGVSNARRVSSQFRRHASRSGNLPLHIYFSALDGPRDSCRMDDQFTAVCRLIWAHASRWGSISLIQSYDGGDPFWPSVRRQPALLHRLHLQDTAIPTWRSLNLSTFAAVTHFSIDTRAGSYPEIDLSLLPFLDNATIRIHTRRSPHIHLRIALPDLIYAMSIVAGCTDLSSLRVIVPDEPCFHIGGRKMSHDISVSTLVFRWKKLTSLLLEGFTGPAGPSWAKILAHLFLEDLLHLRLDEPFPDLDSTLDRWGCSLLSLSITATPGDAFFHLSPSVIKATQNAETFSIFSYSDNRTLRLLDQLTRPSVMPKLCSLVLGLRHNTRFHALPLQSPVGFDRASSLLRLLRSRPQIRRIVAAVDCRDEVGTLVKDELEGLRLDYQVWTFGENVTGMVLRKGLEPRRAIVNQDYHLNLPIEY